MRSLFRTALVGAALAVAVPALGQQITSGTITGITKDEQGLVLPAANVELRNEETGETRHTLSNTAGVFNFPGISVGPLLVESEPSGLPHQRAQRHPAADRAKSTMPASW